MSEAFDLHWDRASELYDEGKFVEAIAEWREASRFDPEDGYVRHSIGLTLSKLGQPEAAIAEWREAVRLEPDYDGPHLSLAYALSAPGYSPEALAAVRAAVRLCPASAGLHTWLGYHLITQASEAGTGGDTAGYEAAAAAFQKAIELDPSSFSALLNLGRIQWSLGNKREAIETLKAAVAADPNSAEAHITLAKYQRHTGQLRAMWQTITAILSLPASEELSRLHASMDRLWLCLKAGFFISAGLAAVVIWNRRRRG